MSITDKIIMFLINVVHNGLDMMDDAGGLGLGESYWLGFFELLDNASYFLRLTCMMTCLLTVVGVQIVFNNVFIVNWVIKRIRGG